MVRLLFVQLSALARLVIWKSNRSGLDWHQYVIYWILTPQWCFILFLKYLLLYISIRYLIENNFLKFKYFFISCGLATIFVCFDIFYQFIFGVDVFGFKEPPPELRKLGGPFGDELIAGGFIQRFGVFSFFVIPLFFKKKFQYLNTYVITILFIIFFFRNYLVRK